MINLNDIGINQFGSVIKTLESQNPAREIQKQLENFIVSPEDPNFSGFELDTTLEATITAETRYTNQALDSGINITQHSSRMPTIINIKGEIYNCKGEKPSKLQKGQDYVNSTFSSVQSYLPMLQGQVMNNINSATNFVKGGIGYVDQAYNTGRSFFEIFSPNTSDSTITAYHKTISALDKAKAPVRVVCQGVVYKDMRITNFSITENNNEGRAVVSIEFKEIIYTTENYALIQKRKLSKALSSKISETVNKGGVEGVDKDTNSFAWNLLNKKL